VNDIHSYLSSQLADSGVKLMSNENIKNYIAVYFYIIKNKLINDDNKVLAVEFVNTCRHFVTILDENSIVKLIKAMNEL